MLQDADGHVVTSVQQVDAGAAVSVRVADGRVHATTTGVEPLDSPTDPDTSPDIEEHHG